MKLAPVALLHVHYAPSPSRRVRVGRLAMKDRQLLFEYAPELIASGLALSPFKLPLRAGLVIGDPSLFGGLPGLFDDSLPDGWGRLLVDRRIAAAGLAPESLGPLDRLAWVGARSMGALVYEPEHGHEPPTVVDLARVERDAQKVLADVEGPDLEALIALGGSPAGARPKALVQLSADGRTLISGAKHIEAGYTPFLVKFRGKGDDRDAAPLELAYARLARVAGIDVPDARLLGRTRRHPGFFATPRFDRRGDERVHLHTLGGLLHAPSTYASLGYRELLLATRALTRDEAAVAEMFRRACFNVFAHNRDDHTKNFAFLMSESGEWRPSPAYDLTFSGGPGGEHSLLVAGEGRSPTKQHLATLGETLGVVRPAAIIEEVRAAMRSFRALADEAGVTSKTTERVAKVLGLGTKTRGATRRPS